jgi:hypothetical protein
VTSINQGRGQMGGQGRGQHNEKYSSRNTLMKNTNLSTLSRRVVVFDLVEKW